MSLRASGTGEFPSTRGNADVGGIDNVASLRTCKLLEVDSSKKTSHQQKETTMPIYMNYNNDAIPGDVSAKGHEKWIELNSFQWGVGRGISAPTGAAADRESSAPSVSEIVVTKATDMASTKLLNEALQGEGVDVKIDFCKTDKGNLETYIQYTLTNTMISGYSLSSGGDRPSESISLNFTKVEFKSTGMDASNADASPETVTYDLALAQTT
jgi:type VI secretion system secreted protein Hcp